MTISRVEIQGQVTRAQDFTTIKHNEDNKGMVDQSNFQRQFDQSVEGPAGTSGRPQRESGKKI